MCSFSPYRQTSIVGLSLGHIRLPWERAVRTILPGRGDYTSGENRLYFRGGATVFPGRGDCTSEGVDCTSGGD